MITKEQLSKIMPNLAKNKARFELHFPLLTAAMAEAKIDTPQRIAAYLAQIAHESYELKYMEEVWGPTPQQLKYEPPNPLAAKLGNTQKGDGYAFRGAGPIQITGRANFKAAGLALGIDLEKSPEKAFEPATGHRLGAWYWSSRKLNDSADKLVLDPAKDVATAINTQADAKVFDQITKKINGGYNGKPHRDSYYKTACLVLKKP